jgi:hypothetical protein
VQRDGLAEPGAEQEQRDDAAALHGPERVAVEVLLDEAEMAQVEAKWNAAIQTIATPRKASRRS